MWGSLRKDREKGESPEESKVWRELTEGGVNGIITENDDERESAGEFKGVLLLEYLYNDTALLVEVCVTVFHSTADFFILYVNQVRPTFSKETPIGNLLTQAQPLKKDTPDFWPPIGWTALTRPLTAPVTSL